MCSKGLDNFLAYIGKLWREWSPFEWMSSPSHSGGKSGSENVHANTLQDGMTVAENGTPIIPVTTAKECEEEM